MQKKQRCTFNFLLSRKSAQNCWIMHNNRFITYIAFPTQYYGQCWKCVGTNGPWRRGRRRCTHAVSKEQRGMLCWKQPACARAAILLRFCHFFLCFFFLQFKPIKVVETKPADRVSKKKQSIEVSPVIFF